MASSERARNIAKRDDAEITRLENRAVAESARVSALYARGMRQVAREADDTDIAAFSAAFENEQAGVTRDAGLRSHAVAVGSGIGDAAKAIERAEANGRTRQMFALPRLSDEARDFILRRGQLTEEDLLSMMNVYTSEALRLTTGLGAAADAEARAAMEVIVADGLTGRGAESVMMEALQKGGFVGKGRSAGWRVETIVRTETRLAHSAGTRQIDQDPAVDEILWGYEYVTVGDDRVRLNHLALDGTRKPKDWDGWLSVTPPNGFNCRCRLIRVFKDEADELGDDLSQEPIEIEDEDTGEVFPAAADKGWDFDPGQLHGELKAKPLDGD